MQIEISTVVSTITAAIIGLNGKIIWDWLKTRRNGNGKADLTKMEQDISFLKNIHNRYDDNGAPLWYFPRGIRESLEKLSEKSAETNILLKEILGALKNPSI